MARAIRLARRGLYSTHPNPRVGCVLVKDERIVSEGWHIKAGDPHAEINAINNTREVLQGASCYVSLEPCSYHGKTPPCSEAIAEAGITKLVAAMVDPNPKVSGSGIDFLNEQGVDTRAGLLLTQAEDLNPGFNKRMREGLPYVRCKFGLSLDGKMSLANGVSQWITSPESRRDVQRLRAESSAIVTGIDTVISDDPSLNVREIDTQGRQPLRVVMDTNLRTPISARILTLPGETVIFTISRDKELQEALEKAGAEVVRVAEDGGRIDLIEAFQYMASEKQVNEVLLEAGPNLVGAMFSARLVDELIIYRAPLIMGDKASSMMILDNFRSMDECISLEMIDNRLIGSDERLTYTIKQPA